MTETIAKLIIDGKKIPFNFEGQLQKFFYLVAVVLSLQCGLIPSENLSVSGDGTTVHTHVSPRGHHSNYAPDTGSSGTVPALRHFSDPDASWEWDK